MVFLFTVFACAWTSGVCFLAVKCGKVVGGSFYEGVLSYIFLFLERGGFMEIVSKYIVVAYMYMRVRAYTSEYANYIFAQQDFCTPVCNSLMNVVYVSAFFVRKVQHPDAHHINSRQFNTEYPERFTQECDSFEVKGQPLPIHSTPKLGQQQPTNGSHLFVLRDEVFARKSAESARNSAAFMKRILSLFSRECHHIVSYFNL